MKSFDWQAVLLYLTHRMCPDLHVPFPEFETESSTGEKASALHTGRGGPYAKALEVRFCYANLRILLPKLPHDFQFLLVFCQHGQKAQVPEMS
jgi:hypothetical protein